MLFSSVAKIQRRYMALTTTETCHCRNVCNIVCCCHCCPSIYLCSVLPRRDCHKCSGRPASYALLGGIYGQITEEFSQKQLSCNTEKTKT